jgi:hypothetical protein
MWTADEAGSRNGGTLKEAIFLDDVLFIIHSELSGMTHPAPCQPGSQTQLGQSYSLGRIPVFALLPTPCRIFPRQPNGFRPADGGNREKTLRLEIADDSISEWIHSHFQ